jgi:hypothetical protein
MSLIFQPTPEKNSGGIMTELTNKKTCIKIDGSNDRSVMDLAEKRGDRDDFFDITKQR